MSHPLDSYGDLIGDSPGIAEAVDAATPAFVTYAARLEERLRSNHHRPTEIDAIAREVHPAAIGFRIALKLAESARVIEALTEPLTVTLVNPVYKETGRMQPRTEHPHGEDSIRNKVDALSRLRRRNPLLRTRFVVVDDECPDGSGAMAEGILAGLADPGDHEVLFLGEAIDDGDPSVPAGLTHKDGPNRSVKGGAVLFAMAHALSRPADGLHVIVDSDADLSIGPAQLGLVLDGIVNQGRSVVAGSRREAESVAVIGSGREARGAEFIRVWQRLLPQLATQITDTNRAFKAFAADDLAGFLADVRTYTFPYQIELLQAAITAGAPLAPRGIAYVDSEAASTQDGADITESYLHQMQQIVDIARRYRTIADDLPLATFLAEAREEDLAELPALLAAGEGTG